jgi:hypothetical protein
MVSLNTGDSYNKYGKLITQQLHDTSEFYKRNPREDAQPEWDDLTESEQRDEDYDRWRDENCEPDPDDQRDNRIFDGDDL